MSIIIRAQKIAKSYPNINTAGNRFKSLISLLFNKKINDCNEVLHDINLNIKKGESLAIIGKNGAGKSTLLKIISGVIKPTKGEVQVNGTIGAMLELGSGFHQEYTGRENLKMSAVLAGITEKNIEQKIDRMIAFADIGDYIDQPVKNYSSGMVVRLGFSVITVTNPDLLITDEVLAVGDTDFQRKCIAWIDQYLENGGTLLLVSHSLYHVQKICKHAIWLENGSVKKSGDSFTVSQEYESFYEKQAIDDNTTVKDHTNYHIKNMSILNSDLQEITKTKTHENVIIRAQIHSPDGRAPGMALGIMKSDIAIYGTISELHQAIPEKINENTFQYNITLPNSPLLPADYTIKTHAMDPECMRLIDTHQKNIRVYAETQEMGVVRLNTEWN